MLRSAVALTVFLALLSAAARLQHLADPALSQEPARSGGSPAATATAAAAAAATASHIEYFKLSDLHVSMTTHGSLGNAKFVRLARDHALAQLAPGTGADARETHRHLTSHVLSRYNVYGLASPATELVPAGRSRRDVHGLANTHHHELVQLYASVPVYACGLLVSVREDRILSLSGTLVPSAVLDGAGLNTEPTRSAEEAVQAARRVLAARESELANLAALTRPELVVFAAGLARHAGPVVPHLAYVFELGTAGRAQRFSVAVDAHTLGLIEALPINTNALYRQLSNVTYENVIWREGMPGTLTGDVNKTMTVAGWTYALFQYAFARDSWDGAGGDMKSIFDDPRISCPNANWNGNTTNYCTGVAGVDTVAHEWGHAYTQGGTNETHGLIYAWQSGALNEAYSDIVGETVDASFNTGVWRFVPDGPRELGVCSQYSDVMGNGQHEVLSVVNTAPCPPGDASAVPPIDFSPATTAAPWTVNFTAPLAVAFDSTANADLLCYASAVDLTGKIALVMRGICDFATKAMNAQAAGAVAVLVQTTAIDPVISPSGVTQQLPFALISYGAGELLRSLVLVNGARPVALQVTTLAPVPLTDSYRWLSGESDPAFGGAIRDMWWPNCYGHPGSVLDPTYQCSDRDNGGVHHNSGVINHMYAMLVDGTGGGTFNGQVVPSIGLTKAFHVYWRAAFTYHTAVTNFADHGQALAQACDDLLGAGPLPALNYSGSSGQVIGAADCAAVAAAAAAVQLDSPPDCVFEPLLNPQPPPTCPSSGAFVIAVESFTSRPAGWTVSSEPVGPGWTPRDWAFVDSLPAGGPGSSGWFAVDPDLGDCGASNQAGSLTLRTANFSVPGAAAGAMVFLELTHYVATESAADGGVLRASIGGAPFAYVPPSQALYNGYTARLVGAPISTNPLGGLAAFSGTDGGAVTGSWATSRFLLNARAEQNVALEFVFGTDCASGLGGWYLGRLQLTACPAVCGDGVCAAAYENCTTCASDCACVCGDGVCSSAAADCEADCCGDGVCEAHELCSVDCCGTLPDCSFETAAMWAIASPMPPTDVILLDPGEWYSGQSGLLVAGYGALNVYATTPPELATTLVQTSFTARGATRLRLSFWLYALCASDATAAKLDKLLQVHINGVRVWSLLSANLTAICKPTIDASFFSQVEFELDVGLAQVDTTGKQNTLTLGGTTDSSVVLVDALQLGLLGVPDCTAGGARSCTKPVAVAITLTLFLTLLLLALGAGLVWVFRARLLVCWRRLVTSKSYAALETTDGARLEDRQ